MKNDKRDREVRNFTLKIARNFNLHPSSSKNVWQQKKEMQCFLSPSHIFITINNIKQYFVSTGPSLKWGLVVRHPLEKSSIAKTAFLPFRGVSSVNF